MQPSPDTAARSDDAGSPRGPRPSGAAFARRAALATALLVLLLAVDAAALQGEPRGPFEAARLSDEPLTDDPAGAFEVLILSAGVALLAAVATCAFLALAKLGAIERVLERGAAKEREAAEALRAEVAALAEAVRAHASPAGGAEADEQLAASIARLEAGIDRVREAIESRADGPDAPGASDVRADLTRIGDDLRGLMEGARASGESASRDALDALRGGLSELRDALQDTLVARSGAAAAGPAPGGAPGVVERIQTRLLALGYTDPVVVTPPEDIAAALDAGGDLVVEARRAGAIHKGRVVLMDGAIADVQLRPSHDIFP